MAKQKKTKVYVEYSDAELLLACVVIQWEPGCGKANVGLEDYYARACSLAAAHKRWDILGLYQTKPWASTILIAGLVGNLP